MWVHKTKHLLLAFHAASEEGLDLGTQESVFRVAKQVIDRVVRKGVGIDQDSLAAR